MSGKAEANFNMLREYGLFKHFFPLVDQVLNRESEAYLLPFITKALQNTDERINNDQRVTPAFLFAAMLWYPLQEQIKALNETAHLTPQDAFFSAISEIMSEQQRSIGIPKRFQGVMKDILILQDKLSRREGKRAYKAFEHPKFRAGYDFLLLRSEIEGINSPELAELAKWWTDFQVTPPETREQMIKSVVYSRSTTKRSPRKKRKPKAKTAVNTTESE